MKGVVDHESFTDRWFDSNRTSGSGSARLAPGPPFHSQEKPFEGKGGDSLGRLLGFWRRPQPSFGPEESLPRQPWIKLRESPLRNLNRGSLEGPLRAPSEPSWAVLGCPPSLLGTSRGPPERAPDQVTREVLRGTGGPSWGSFGLSWAYLEDLLGCAEDCLKIVLGSF